MTQPIRKPTFFAVPAGARPTECRSCKATIYFVELGSGRNVTFPRLCGDQPAFQVRVEKAPDSK